MTENFAKFVTKKKVNLFDEAQRDNATTTLGICLRAQPNYSYLRFSVASIVKTFQLPLV